MLNQEIDDILKKCGAAEKAAMRLLIDLPETILNPDAEKLLEQSCSGVILFQKNIENRDQTAGLITQLQSVNETKLPSLPLFIAVDQEGGSVSPLEPLITPSPGNMGLAASGDFEGAYALARRNGKELRDLGFNVNFSPVMDVNSNPRNPIIGIRSFGENAELVSRFGIAVIRGYQDEGVMATAKHFPGHGDTSKDSHLDLPVVDRSRDTLEKIDFLPFEKGIQAGVWGIMTAHVIYPGLDSKPATLSSVILTDILRKNMGFQGIVFTDSFEMAAIKDHFSLEEAVIESVKAGADILLNLGSSKTQLQIFEILKKAIEKQTITDEHIIPSLRRILYFRKKLHNFQSKEPLKLPLHFVEDLHAKTVTIVNGKERLPLTRTLQVLLLPEATQHAALFRETFPGWEFIEWPWPVFNSHRMPSYMVFLAEKRLLSPDAENALTQAAPNVECAVSFGNPYLLAKFPQAAVRVTAYHLNPLLAHAVYRVLVEGKDAQGKLPITL